MFTGLVAGTGELLARDPLGPDCRLRIRAAFSIPDLVPGESIAVNGACLSVENGTGSLFQAYASAETLKRTTLGLLAPGSTINLERALQVGSRLGGHLVSGHVDCLARIRRMEPQGQSLRVRLEFPTVFAPEVIPKGSVALDGVSLTVNDCGADFLEVNIIPETRRSTAVGLWRTGDVVNMETDLIGKYVRRIIDARRDEPKERSAARLTPDFLHEHGFF